jgi:RNA polymerase sigma-70 factor, ECF subfamily
LDSVQASTPEIRRAIDAIWRIESAKLIAGLTRIVRDVALAEDLAQDALVAALKRWPESGIPENPGAWLMASAKYIAIDLLRRNTRLQRKQEQMARDIGIQLAMDAHVFESSLADEVGDELLGLMFICCHPVLSTDARVTLTLRLLGGLTTAEIARAFLAPPETIAQRIVRAKRTLRQARASFEVPGADELDARVDSVLEVLYLIFNEGYSATAGEDWMRPALCEEALRLGRVLAELAPREPEVHGLVALMEIQASRTAARVGPGGEPILLLEQDRRRWDRLLIGRGLRALERAQRLGGRPGPYVLQAAIASCHAIAPAPARTDWVRIAALYGELVQVLSSPVVELNRAVAIGMAHGPAAGLEIVDALLGEPALESYHLLGSVRGDLLVKLERFAEARIDFERAATLTDNARERALCLDRAAACAREIATREVK